MKFFRLLFFSSVVFAFSNINAIAEPLMHGHDKHETQDSSVSMHAMRHMGPKHSWKDPKVQLSPVPNAMGKQMGQVHTLNVPALGYEMDGDVKVFTLIAQPVERVITEGKSREFEPIKKFELPG